MSSSFIRKAFLFGTLALAPVAARADDTTDTQDQATKATDEAKDTANKAATDTQDQAGKAADATKDTTDKAADKATQETKDQAGKAADKASQGAKDTGDKAKSMYDEPTH